jgi:hypothetical protein
MNTLYLILYIIAFACLVAAALGATVNRVNLLAAGLAFWVLVPLIHAFRVVT